MFNSFAACIKPSNVLCSTRFLSKSYTNTTFLTCEQFFISWARAKDSVDVQSEIKGVSDRLKALSEIYHSPLNNPPFLIAFTMVGEFELISLAVLLSFYFLEVKRKKDLLRWDK